MRLKSFLAPPIFKNDREKTQKAVILNTSIWTVLTILLLLILNGLIGEKIPPLVTLLAFVLFVITFAVRHLLFQGKEKIANIIFLLNGLVFTIVAVIATGTIRSSATVFFFLIIIIASFQLDKKGAIITNFIVALILYALISAENHGYLNEANFEVGLEEWFIYTMLFFFTGNLIIKITSKIQENLEHAEEEIEKRKKAEEKLNIYIQAFEQNAAAVIITNPKGEIERVNAKFSKLTGYSLEEAVGKTPRILKSGEHSEKFYTELWQMIFLGNEWFGELRNKKKNGDLYWERASIFPVFDDEMKIIHYVGTKEDISLQKLAEENLKRIKEALINQLQKNKELQKKLYNLAMRDPLTELYNRRYMDEILEKECKRAKRYKHSVSLILLDLDKLKIINDTLGHAIGDRALRSIAAQLKASTRGDDTICKYGGDEFAIILPNTTGKNALKRAEELRKKMEEITLLNTSNKTIRITFTAGVATYPTHGTTIAELFNFADIALYRAKLAGRNRVELFSPEEE